MIRYSISRQIIHFGLWVMPDGRYKRRLLEVLWALHKEVLEEVMDKAQ